MTASDGTIEAAISAMPEGIQGELGGTLSTGGVIPAEVYAPWLEAHDIEIGALMIELLPVAAAYARVPVSGFHVGAVALGIPTGSLYLGSNVEFAGQALGFCVHGEQSATNNAWLNGETGLQALAVNAAPCGYCRQFLHELTTGDELEILLRATDPMGGAYTSKPLIDYLPDAFGPEDLGLTGDLMQHAAHGLTISEGGKAAQAALGAANASYSPMTGGYSGVALVGADGQTYVGRYAENAAGNPSMSPMESAVAFMTMSRTAQAPLDVTSACLVEAESTISQRALAEAELSSVAPGVILDYVPAR